MSNAAATSSRAAAHAKNRGSSQGRGSFIMNVVTNHSTQNKRMHSISNDRDIHARIKGTTTIARHGREPSHESARLSVGRTAGNS